jgi:hypothetical protein
MRYPEQARIHAICAQAHNSVPNLFLISLPSFLDSLRHVPTTGLGRLSGLSYIRTRSAYNTSFFYTTSIIPRLSLYHHHLEFIVLGVHIGADWTRLGPAIRQDWGYSRMHGIMGYWGPISMGPGLCNSAYFIGSSLICIIGSGIQIEARPNSGDIIIEWHAHAIH